MPRFDYRVQDGKGQVSEGVIDADNLELATVTLQDRGLTVLSLEGEKRDLLNLNISFLDRVSGKDIVVFTRQLAVLIGAKVPIVQSLRSVTHQTKNPVLKRIASDVASEVESGTPLSEALAMHPKAFSKFYVSIIRSGQTTGRLDDVMNYLADQMEKDYDLMSRIKGAMTYPIFVIVGLVIVGFIMMSFVVPKMTQSLTESGMELPWTTKSLIAVSSFFQGNWVGLLVGLVVGIVAFKYWTRQGQGKLYWDEAKIRIPVFGPLIRYIVVVRFTRSMSTLISGGVDVPSALAICSDIVGNEHYSKTIDETRKEVMDGNSITTIFYRDSMMPSMIPQMLTVGEETGRITDVLDKLTSFYSRELDNSVGNLVSAIEPLIMLVMGGAVGVMVAAIMMPMYQMAMGM